MTHPPSEPVAGDDAPSLSVRCVRALMERHGVPKYRQSAWLAANSGLSYAQAHRRMNGAAAWTLEELERVAALLGESLIDVVSLGEAAGGSVPATMRVGTASVPCDLWIGSQVEHPKPDSIVAVKTSSGWAAVCASEATDTATYTVERLHAKPQALTRTVIAVLDDDEDLTDSICAHLEDSGYEARPYYRTADLQASLDVVHHDGYVIDWIVGESSTAQLIAAIRAQDAAAPIVVLTAQVLAGVVQESEIAEAVARYDFVFAEKPVRMAILSASLARAFAAK
jgi:CheY-like chemotaxis protein